MAQHSPYYDTTWRLQEFTCPTCGWCGCVDDMEQDWYAELTDFSCPSCDKMILIVSYPTLHEIKQAALSGNAEAIKELRIHGIPFIPIKGSMPLTIRIIIEDGLGFPSGTVWPASYVCVIFCNVPETWLDGEQGLKEEKRERVFEQQYGKTWRRGNDDGSYYVIRRFEVDVLESTEALHLAKLSIDESNAQERCWFYLIDEEERFEKVDKDTFFDNSM